MDDSKSFQAMIKLAYGTQRNAAYQLGLNEQTLSNWCTGKAKPQKAIAELVQIKALLAMDSMKA